MRPQLRLLGELVLVVIGVLLAFQVEGMRDARETRSRAAVHLQALRDDLAENKSRLAASVAGLNRGVAAARAILRISNGDDPVPSTDEVIDLISSSIGYSRVEPVTGAYDALVAAGDLRLIRNAQLRSALANFLSDVREPHEVEQLSTQLRAQLVEAVAESTSFLAIMGPRLRGIADLPRSSITPDIDALLSSRAYLSNLALLATNEAGIALYYADLEAEAARIIGLIDAEIAGEP